jgi:hypothetical protein
MNELETKFSAGPGDSTEELRNEVQSLRAIISLALVVMIIFAVCVDVFLFKQVSIARAQITQSANVYNQVNGNFPREKANEFITKLNDYARTHPDFLPVLEKYRQFPGIVLTTPPSASPKK